MRPTASVAGPVTVWWTITPLTGPHLPLWLRLLVRHPETSRTVTPSARSAATRRSAVSGVAMGASSAQPPPWNRNFRPRLYLRFVGYSSGSPGSGARAAGTSVRVDPAAPQPAPARTTTRTGAAMARLQILEL